MQRSRPLTRSCRTMEANLRAVPATPAEEAYVSESGPSFEEFYEATFRRLFTAFCLVTGDRHLFF